MKRTINTHAALYVFIALTLSLAFVTFVFVEHGEASPASFWHTLETTVFIESIAISIFTGWAWRSSIFAKWLIRIPYLGGCWVGTLDPDGGPTKRVVVQISQGLFHATCRVYTNEMVSRSFSAQVYYDDATDEECLTYSYATDPNYDFREENPRHDGTAKLHYDRVRRTLRGNYWTDRRTRGTLEIAYRSRSCDPNALLPRT